MARTAIRILIVAHHGFVDVFRGIVAHIGEPFEIDVISNRALFWRRKGRVRRTLIARKYDIVHFHCGNTDPVELWLLRNVARVTVVNQFMGTELYRLLQGPHRDHARLRACARRSVTATVGFVLTDELREIGITAETLHLVSLPLHERPYTYPDGRSAIAYLPSETRDFYRYALLHRLAGDFPDTAFTWFPYVPGPGEQVPPNVRCLPHMPREDVLAEMERARVFLRLPEHDGGAPLSLVEALSLGRWVVWTYAMPHTAEVGGSYEVLKTAFGGLVDRTDPNTEGAAYVRREFAMERISGGFVRLYRRICTGTGGT